MKDGAIGVGSNTRRVQVPVACRIASGVLSQLLRFGDGNQLEPLSEGFGFQARQFPFGTLLLEFRRAPIDPCLAFGEHPLDQQCQIGSHGFDGRRVAGQVFA